MTEFRRVLFDLPIPKNLPRAPVKCRVMHANQDITLPGPYQPVRRALKQTREKLVEQTDRETIKENVADRMKQEILRQSNSSLLFGQNPGQYWANPFTHRPLARETEDHVTGEDSEEVPLQQQHYLPLSPTAEASGWRRLPPDPPSTQWTTLRPAQFSMHYGRKRGYGTTFAQDTAEAEKAIHESRIWKWRQGIP